MAAVPTLVKQSIQGSVREKIYTVALDASYPTNGYPLSFQQLGFTKVPLSVDVETLPAGLAARTFYYDRVNQKLLAYVTAGTEVPNATDCSAVTARVIVEGVA